MYLLVYHSALRYHTHTGVPSPAYTFPKSRLDIQLTYHIINNHTSFI